MYLPPPFYRHDSDEAWTYRGESLKHRKPYIQARFRVILLVIFVFEVLASAWPITATVIYGTKAAITWFWFVYVVRAMLLLYPFVFYENVLHLVGAGGYRGLIHWGRIPAAFVPCYTLYIWSWLSLIVGGIFGAMVTVASAAAWPLYASNVLGGLSIGFSALFFLESVSAVFILYWKGVWVPVEKSRTRKGALGWDT
jgi:hypothetical protein